MPLIRTITHEEGARAAMRLYHFTCDHMARGIRRTGKLMPNRSPFWGDTRLVWLTDLAVPDKHGLGLNNQSGLLTCNRTECRFITDAAAVPWLRSTARKHLPATLRTALEGGRLPEHWWVTDVAIAVREG